MSLEKLEHDVAVKLAHVDKSLSQVEEYQKQLHENALKIKEEIHEAVERQVGSLLGRERQLVRQVEVVTAHQTCLLSTQQAGLMHSQGALTATKNLLQRCTSADVSTLSKIKMDDLSCTKNIRPVNLVSVQLNESALNSAIQGFGCVQLPDTITHHPSPVIPAKVEDYGDEDHDVLHKSVAGSVAGPDSPVRITVQFPRLSHQNWLMGQQNKSSEQSPSTKVRKVEQNRSNCDVTTWLGNLQLAGIQDEDESAPSSGSIGSFDFVSSSLRTSESSSIEIVPSHFDSDKDDCSAMGSTCEIENLPLCLEEKSRWLSPKHSASRRQMLQQIKVSEACQANEPCSDFSECICKGTCADAALQKVQQSATYQSKICRKRTISEAEATDSVLAHMANILSSDNSLWLMRNHDIQTYMPRPAKRAMYAEPEEKWLNRCAPSNVAIPCPMPKISLSAHSNIWLLRKLKADKSSVKEEKDEAEIEKATDEKESSRITTEDLSEALRKVTFDSMNLDLSNFYAARKASGLSKEPSKCLSGHPWLLSKTGDVRHSVDNKLQEKEVSSKKKWLASSSLTDLEAMHCEENVPPTLPPAVLALAQADLNSWLIKRL